ncbi:MAG: hypothetical protein E3J54_03570 [Actinobacteria bacterium]|nr:MAG: hypothetical protein E3J54_03570 [Actinomycetota bacterium]
MKNTVAYIEELRKKIDAIDVRLLNLFNDRAKLSQAVKKLKLVQNLPILDKEREAQIHKMVKENNKGPLKEADLEKLFMVLLEAMREIDVS